MADSKITDLTELATADVAHDDLIEVIDISASANKKAKVASVISPSSAAKSADFTFAVAEANRTTVVDSASAVVATIPTNASVAYALGTRLRVYRKGAGSVKITPDTGVTLRLPTGIKPARFMGARAKKSADQTAANYSAGVIIAWDAESFDTDAFHDTSTNNSRMTIPSGLGIKSVNVKGDVYVSSLAASNYTSAVLYKDGAQAFEGASAGDDNSATFTAKDCLVIAQNVKVADGSYFEIWFATADTSITVVADKSSFAIEVTEIDAQGWVAYQYGVVEIEKIGTNEWIVTDHSALG